MSGTYPCTIVGVPSCRNVCLFEAGLVPLERALTDLRRMSAIISRIDREIAFDPRALEVSLLCGSSS